MSARSCSLAFKKERCRLGGIPKFRATTCVRFCAAKLVLARQWLSFRATVTQPTVLLANPDAVTLDVRATTGEEAIRALQVKLGAAGGAVMDQPKFLADLIERAHLASVCIAVDVALPHARTAAVSRIVLAVGRVVGEAAFDAEHPAVRLLFLVGTPKSAAGDYLQLVAAISRLLKNPAARAGLLAAKTEEEFRGCLAGTTEVRR
jgi:mannitol/fructose-specific phosphotransferase system IIA component (Ntr-type)